MVEGQEKAPTAPGAATGKDGRADLQAQAKILEAYRLLFYGPIHKCTADPCIVPVTPSIVAIGGQDICIAKLPESLEFSNTSGANPPKTITWVINPGGKRIEFHASNGILMVDNAKQQIKPDNARTNPVTYSAKNKHNQNDKPTYVPVILYWAVAGLPPSLCATGDPQIVNN